MKVYIVTGNIAWHEDGPVAVFTDQAAANDYRHTGNHDEVYGVEVWDVVPERAEVLTLPPPSLKASDGVPCMNSRYGTPCQDTPT